MDKIPEKCLHIACEDTYINTADEKEYLKSS